MDIKLVLTFLLIVVACGRPRERIRHHVSRELRTCSRKLENLSKIVKRFKNVSHSLQKNDFEETRHAVNSLEDSTTNHEKMQAMDPNVDGSNEPRYKLMLNEVNTDNPGPDSHVFVELKAIRRPVEGDPQKSDVYGFMLLLLKGDPLSIVFSLDIGEALHKVSGKFITIGPKGYLKNVDIDIYAPEVCSVSRSNLEPLPIFDDVPHAIVVIHSKLESIRAELSLEPVNGVCRPSLLNGDERRQNLIRDHVVDVLTIGRKTPYSFCTFFESLKPKHLVNPERKALLRDWDGPNGLPISSDYREDMSLSRCCSDEQTSDQDCWTLGPPSLNEENPCENKRPIYLEKIIHNIATSTETTVSVPESRGQCHAGYPEVSASLYGLINDHDYAKAVDEELEKQSEQCSTNQDTTPPQDLATDAHEPMEVEEASEALMVPRHIFNQHNFDRCRFHLTKINEINVPAITSWLDVIHEHQKCKFRCYNCHLYLQKGFRPDVKQPPLFVTTGYLSKYPSRNKGYILDHIDPKNTDVYKMHQDATAYVHALQQAQTVADVKAAEKAAHESQKLLLKPTMNAMKLAYAELRAEISFRSHELFFETVKELDVNLGNYHATDHSLRMFANAFSDGFHERLLNHLKDKQPPFSFIVDATTSRNTGFLICLLQTIENGYPVLHMWRLISLTKSESGKDMMDDISHWIDMDDANVNGFKQFFKSRLTTFISDRGSAMVGHRKGLLAHLRRYTGRDIPSVSCSAHKTETSIKHALDIPTGEGAAHQKPPKWFTHIGDLNNKIYTHYMSRGSKRFAVLQEIGEELGMSATRIKYHHDIRWSQSKKAAVDTLLNNLDVIREDLRRSATSTNKDTREKAENLLKIVNERNFCSALAEFSDMLAVSERMLNAFQLKHGLTLGISDTIRTGLRSFDGLKTTAGKSLTAFLARTSCEGVCEEPTCTLEQYDSCDSITYRPEALTKAAEADTDSAESSIEESAETEDGTDSVESGSVTLRTDVSLKSVPLSAWRNTLYDRIIQEVKTLFNVKVLEAFDALNPKQFKFCPDARGHPKCANLISCYKPFTSIHSSDEPEDVEAKLLRLCEFYKTEDCDALIANYKIVLSSIVVSDRYRFLSGENDPSGFWAYALSDPALPWQSDVRGLVQLVLVTGQSSASAERAFSALTRLRSKDRSSLQGPMLDTLIRVAFNGPERIDEESLYEYTLTFLKSHKRVDQINREVSHKSVDKEQKVSPRMFYKSRLYSTI